MSRKTEAVTPPATIQRLLDAGGDDLVLVGGQALAFWVDWYGLSHRQPEVPAISNDVDFLSGVDGDTVRKRAVRIMPAPGHSPFMVMHPLDVLHSRLANLHKLRDKQNDKGRMQLALAIDVGREFLRGETREAEAVETAAGRSPIQGYVSAIERLATEDAGRKVAARHGLHVADAIDPHLIPPGPFWTKRWPALQKLMSPQYRGTIQVPAEVPAKNRS